MTAVEDIKAGTYVLVAHRWDEITSKPGEPLDFVRHREGDKLNLDIEQARRLVVAGAVVKPSELKADGKAPVPGSEPSVAPGGSRDEGAATPSTKAEILAEVGDDPEKAKAALELEQSSDAPRVTLVAELEKVITAGAGS